MKKVLIKVMVESFASPRKMLLLCLAVSTLLGAFSNMLFLWGLLTAVVILLIICLGIFLWHLNKRKHRPRPFPETWAKFVDIVDGNPPPVIFGNPASRVAANEYHAFRLFWWFIISSIVGNVLFAHVLNDDGESWTEILTQRAEQGFQLLIFLGCCALGIAIAIAGVKQIFSETKKPEKPASAKKTMPTRRVHIVRRP